MGPRFSYSFLRTCVTRIAAALDLLPHFTKDLQCIYELCYHLIRQIKQTPITISVSFSDATIALSIVHFILYHSEIEPKCPSYPGSLF